MNEYEIREAWGRYLQELHPWKWWVTLTMRDVFDADSETGWNRLYPGWNKMGFGSAQKMWSEFYLEALDYTGDIGHAKHFQWVCVTEIQQQRGVPHIHALVGEFSQHVAVVRLWAWKRWGFNKIVPYNVSHRREWYIAKYLSKEVAYSKVEFSKGLKWKGGEVNESGYRKFESTQRSLL